MRVECYSVRQLEVHYDERVFDASVGKRWQENQIGSLPVVVLNICMHTDNIVPPTSPTATAMVYRHQRHPSVTCNTCSSQLPLG